MQAIDQLLARLLQDCGSEEMNNLTAACHILITKHLAENAALKEQVAQLQTIISEEATDSGNVILELAAAKETIAQQAEELSESQKHINHLRMALADAEALELGTCERLAKARSMLAQQADALRVKDEATGSRVNDRCFTASA